MDRRELLKLLPLAAIPLVRHDLPEIGSNALASVEVSPGKFVLFVDPQAVDLVEMERNWHWDVDMMMVPVRLRMDQSMSDVVALYSVKDNAVDAEIGPGGLRYEIKEGKTS